MQKNIHTGNVSAKGHKDIPRKQQRGAARRQNREQTAKPWEQSNRPRGRKHKRIQKSRKSDDKKLVYYYVIDQYHLYIFLPHCYTVVLSKLSHENIHLPMLLPCDKDFNRNESWLIVVIGSYTTLAKPAC